MSVLLLRLAGPLQSWGASSRFVRRETRAEPTKSGVIGLIAAAQGRRRTDPVEDLVKLVFGVRVDQPGRLIRDFQTARSLDGSKPMPLSYRFYLGDAVFVAGLQADRALLEGIEEAIKSPTFPLYLGRRSCPPTGVMSLGVKEGDLRTVLRTEPWHASTWYQKARQSNIVALDFLRDAVNPDERGETVRDEPISFDQEKRDYGWRTVVRDEMVEVENHAYRGHGLTAPTEHDPMSALGGR